MKVLPLACIAGAVAIAAVSLFCLRISNIETVERSGLGKMSNHGSGQANSASEFEVFKQDDGTIQLAINGKSFPLRFPDRFNTTKITELRVVNGNRSGGLLCAILLKETGEDLANFWCCMIGDERVTGGVGNTDNQEDNSDRFMNTLSVSPMLCGKGHKDSRFLATSTDYYQLVVITGRGSRHSVPQGNIFVCEYEFGATYARLGDFVTEYPKDGFESTNNE